MDPTVTLERLRVAAGDLLSVAPNIAAAVAILVIGYAVARIVRSVLVRLLQSTTVFGERTGAPGEPSAATIGTFVFYFIMLLVILASFNVLNLSLTDAIVNTITALPIVAAASGTLVRTLSASMLVISGAVLVILFAWVLARLLFFFSVKAVGGVRSRSAKARLAPTSFPAGAGKAPRYKNENDAALDLIKGFIKQTDTEPEEPTRRMPAGGGARREADAAALSREPAAETDNARQADKPHPAAQEKTHPAVRQRPGRMLLIEAAKYDDYQPAVKPDVHEAAAKREARRPSAKAAAAAAAQPAGQAGSAAAPLKPAKAALRRTAGAAKPVSRTKSAAVPAKPASSRAKPAAPPAKQPKAAPAEVKPASAPAKPRAASAAKPVAEPAKPTLVSKKSTSGGPKFAAAGRHLEEALHDEPARPAALKKGPKRGLR